MDELNKIVEMLDIDTKQTEDGLYLYPKTDSRAIAVATVCIQQHIWFSIEWDADSEPGFFIP